MTIPREMTLDVVRELVNIASGNAANALAAMVGQRTMISVPRVTMEPVERVASIIGTSEQTVVVGMQLEGDVTGWLLFLAPIAAAHALSARLLGRATPASGEFDAAGRSALEETANVLAGAYAGTLALMIGGVVMISVPGFAVEPPDDVLLRYRAAAATLTEALCIETTIAIGDDCAPCGAHMVLLPVGPGLMEMMERIAAG